MPECQQVLTKRLQRRHKLPLLPNIQPIMSAHAETRSLDSYEMRNCNGPSAALYAIVEQEDADWQNQRSLWDKVLGLGTMALISICGWAVIIEMVRLLR